MGCINTEKPGSLARFLPRFLREQTYHSYAPCASSVAQLLSLGSNREQDCAGYLNRESTAQHSCSHHTLTGQHTCWAWVLLRKAQI